MTTLYFPVLSAHGEVYTSQLDSNSVPVTKAISNLAVPFIVKLMDLSDFFVREFASPGTDPHVFLSFLNDFRRQDLREFSDN